MSLRFPQFLSVCLLVSVLGKAQKFVFGRTIGWGVKPFVFYLCVLLSFELDVAFSGFGAAFPRPFFFDFIRFVSSSV